MVMSDPYLASLFLGLKEANAFGRRYTKLRLQVEKNKTRAHHKYEMDIRMTDCLVLVYPA